MGIPQFGEFKQLTCDNLTASQSFTSKNVTFNEGDKFLNVKDNNGKSIFYVNNQGASINQIEKSISLENIEDFPDLKVGVLRMQKNRLHFSKDLELDELEVESANINNLEVLNLKLNKLNLPTLNADNITNSNLQTKSINADEAKITNLTTNELSSKTIVTEDIKTNTLSFDDLKTDKVNTNEVITDTINSTELSSKKANIDSLVSDDAGIAKLECKNIMVQNIDIIETANVKVLNNEEAYIADAHIAEAEIKILKVDKIYKPCAEFGSLKKPLELNAVHNPVLDVNNEQNNIIIYNSITNKAPQNKFELINLPDAKYNISVICYNQAINVVYNLCKINEKTYIHSRFSELPKDLVVEIYLERI
tara:strand:+ start:119 stop:1210 length:1092 start_codon:yes stop_codon:yes gene_type:complete